MSYNAILDWANSAHVDTESWGRYLERTYARPREMTAADLGLPMGQWDLDWLNNTYGKCPMPLRVWLDSRVLVADSPPRVFCMRRWTDAPYSFWLGAGAHG